MSFEHKYLKYKQKYLELKEELSRIQQTGGSNVERVSESSDIFDLEKLTETPSLSNIENNQVGGFTNLEHSTDSNNIEEDVEKLTEQLTESGKIETVVTIESSEEEKEEEDSSEKHSSEKHSSEKHSSEKHSSEKHSSEKPKPKVATESPTEGQEGGNIDLDTSISELDEIFSQLGGNKKNDDSSSSSSDLSSLSDLDDSSSEFDL